MAEEEQKERNVEEEDWRVFEVLCGEQEVSQFNGLNWSLLVKHLEFEDMHNSWLYCFTNPLELGTRVSLLALAKHVSKVQEDKWNNITKSCVYLQRK